MELGLENYWATASTYLHLVYLEYIATSYPLDTTNSKYIQYLAKYMNMNIHIAYIKRFIEIKLTNCIYYTIVSTLDVDTIEPILF